MTRKTETGEVRRSNIRDVAARAGVSAATVSRVLGGVYPVSAQTRARVLVAVRELDYVADARAKAIAGVGTPALAFVLEDVTSPPFALMAYGVEREAAALGHLCLVRGTEGDARQETEFVEMMRAQRAAAVILVGGTADTPEYRERTRQMAEALASAGSRLVLCGRPPLDPGAPVTVIGYDNESGAHELVSHVLAQGHRRVLFLGGRPDHTTAQGRERGYVSAHRARGVDVDPALVLHGEFTRDCGHRLMRQALDDGLDFTAVVAATDLVAAGALTALHEAGLRVPDDVSLAGYDDIPGARDLFPALTTVHVPYEELGRVAVRTALGRTPGAPDEHLLLGTHVVVRDSVRPLGDGG